jgi:hypothetical protein
LDSSIPLEAAPAGDALAAPAELGDELLLLHAATVTSAAVARPVDASNRNRIAFPPIR